ncbi:hypothetical protein H2201_000135 [Coniosporium apollinis]|uniref:DUF2415 domain-containing protein n=1 Tax=Coniosporium apollinis TaxID=61459 RepID=A0ABQ9P596_9PEZI|nr:hypothetical protein H2201_000135 [Coniosporium apollinis]
MAVDEFFSSETDSLTLPTKSFYPVRIPIAHFQLRHYISSPEPDHLYYSSGEDVYCLNTATGKRTHIATLPFEARCTASGYGWICVGGESHGHFAAIKLDGAASLQADVDSLLPLEFGGPVRRPLLSPRVKLERIGDEIVNSISIHRLEEEGEGENIVAVLTNNDKTVRIYSLTHGLETTVLDLPFCINHATISPDGQLLIAVGDYHQAYFFQRVDRRQTRNSAKGQAPGSPSTAPEWANISVVQLYVPSSGTLTTGYFTTAWSPSGALVAVGSECGYITVFDAELLVSSEWGEDAIVQIIRSSRPDTQNGPGAIRTMLFSPQPWDLLIWSEDQGRICVADIRTGLRTKQVIQLDPREEGLRRIEVSDLPDDMPAHQLEQRVLDQEANFIRRYRRALDDEGISAAVNHATEYLETSIERRRLRAQAGVVESDNDPHGLTEQERSILEALRVTRQREEARSNGVIPRSINYTSANNHGPPETRRSARTSLTDLAALARVPSQSAPGAGLALPSLGSIREFLRDRHLDTPPPDDRSYQPRRQASVTLGDGSTAQGAPRTTSTAARLGDAQAPTDAWRAISDAMTRSPATIPATPTTTTSSSNTAAPTLPPYPNPQSDAARTSPPRTYGDARVLRQLIRQQELLRAHINATDPGARLDPPVASSSSALPSSLSNLTVTAATTLDPRSTLGMGAASYSNVWAQRRMRLGHHLDARDGVRTAGLAMNEDGRTLWVGTEEGIFEIGINVRERMRFGAVVPR